MEHTHLHKRTVYASQQQGLPHIVPAGKYRDTLLRSAIFIVS
ncbi:hypothetical protein RvY_14763 [Ramazzottius varieornatus]|uniref:Uncharacterized protein n=1 Tax=Ramazzottius varieornatus TaxID=947166 RepID=A0A1D1VW63_RAMVA|nr:hypothetical protein RvY_14763 [Ramazzottius varieornatus]